MWDVLKQFWLLLRERKSWFLVPVVVCLALFGALMVFAQSSALSPLIYALF